MSLPTEIIEVTWIGPLEVILQSGLSRIFRSANDARLFLEGEWPVRRGNHYERALMYCRAAERRQVSSEAAREAFLAACLEAGLEIGRSCLQSDHDRDGSPAAANMLKPPEPAAPLGT